MKRELFHLAGILECINLSIESCIMNVPRKYVWNVFVFLAILEYLAGRIFDATSQNFRADKQSK